MERFTATKKKFAWRKHSSNKTPGSPRAPPGALLLNYTQASAEHPPITTTVYNYSRWCGYWRQRRRIKQKEQYMQRSLVRLLWQTHRVNGHLSQQHFWVDGRASTLILPLCSPERERKTKHENGNGKPQTIHAFYLWKTDRLAACSAGSHWSASLVGERPTACFRSRDCDFNTAEIQGQTSHWLMIFIGDIPLLDTIWFPNEILVSGYVLYEYTAFEWRGCAVVARKSDQNLACQYWLKTASKINPSYIAVKGSTL